MDALPPGSFLAVCDGVEAHLEPVQEENLAEAMELWQQGVAQNYHMCSVEDFTRYFDGFELLDPGVVTVMRWRPEPAEIGDIRDLPQYCGLARKP
ncbi:MULTISPECIES: SAM-dependent methyltransferase [unclassified Nocardiopsis]|uniref:SAM-dependent methyltransferase n=1 Tax=Nocardiopsis TaxID=2013 RepID=UPI00387ABEDC